MWDSIYKLFLSLSGPRLLGLRVKAVIKAWWWEFVVAWSIGKMWTWLNFWHEKKTGERSVLV